jgi:hypothetical protein
VTFVKGERLWDPLLVGLAENELGRIVAGQPQAAENGHSGPG